MSPCGFVDRPIAAVTATPSARAGGAAPMARAQRRTAPDPRGITQAAASAKFGDTEPARLPHSRRRGSTLAVELRLQAGRTDP